MSFLSNTNNAQKRKVVNENTTKSGKKKVKKEELSIKENKNEEEFGLLNPLVVNFNDGNLTTDENDSNLTMLDDEFENDEEIDGNYNVEDNANDESIFFN